MNKDLLTFELTKDGDTIEIHTDEAGLSKLLNIFQRVLKNGDHEHLMTPRWGGVELSEEKQGEDNKLIDHVKIFLWK